MNPTYFQIVQVCNETLEAVRASGIDLDRCIWEFSPSIRETLFRELEKATPYPWRQMYANGAMSFKGVYIRRGVTDEDTGILLKQVNLHPYQ